jgi:hypothetical protein
MDAQLNTDAQQIAIDLLVDRVKLACVCLLEKKQALDKEPIQDEAKLKVLMLRLDMLLKFEKHLLVPIKEHYAFMPRGINELDPGDFFSLLEDVDRRFTKSVMHGI